MRKLIKKSQLKDDARLLSNKIVESIETCAGVIGFSPSSSFKRILGSFVINIFDGGLNLRYYYDGRVIILCHLIISYPVSLKAVGEVVTQNIKYWVNYYGFDLKSLNVVIDGLIKLFVG